MDDANRDYVGNTDPPNYNLPIYPKSFFEMAGRHREPRRVFVAMPFAEKHSDDLWDVICGVCAVLRLNAIRADKCVGPNPIMVDILDELERAEIIIADVTKLNPNVFYELGLAHARCESVILLAREKETLPFDLGSIRCIFFDLDSESGRVALSERLTRTLRDLRKKNVPAIIEDPLERTRVIIDDLQVLARLRDEVLSDQTIWFSGGLSAFAIPPNEPFAKGEEEFQNALAKERGSLLNLAQRGCRIRGIITPVPIVPTARRPDRLLKRMGHLLMFLQGEDEALESIEWCVSPFRQKNMYIIGRVSYIEGYKKGIQRGYGLSSRQTSFDAIDASVSLYEALFQQLAERTLEEYYPENRGGISVETLRQATINCLKKVLDDQRNNG